MPFLSPPELLPKSILTVLFRTPVVVAVAVAAVTILTVPAVCVAVANDDGASATGNSDDVRGGDILDENWVGDCGTRSPVVDLTKATGPDNSLPLPFFSLPLPLNPKGEAAKPPL